MTHGFSLRKCSRRRIAVAVALIFIAALDFSHNVNAQETLSIAIAGENFIFLPFRIAQEKGFYKKHHLNVQHVRIPSYECVTDEITLPQFRKV
jgi:ABC-type nitrate/sulfonate/bicarbonate transport system substrate-binding protein